MRKQLNGTLTNATKIVVNGQRLMRANVNWLGRGKIVGKMNIAYTKLAKDKVYTKTGYWRIQEV